MHRLDRDTLYFLIHGVIQCSRLKRHRSGRQITASLDTHEGQSKLAELICRQIDNDSRMVIQTEFVGFPHQRLGTWDVDEPAPARVPIPPLAPNASPKDQ
jgi:hypothetical protein